MINFVCNEYGSCWRQRRRCLGHTQQAQGDGSSFWTIGNHKCLTELGFLEQATQNLLYSWRCHFLVARLHTVDRIVMSKSLFVPMHDEEITLEHF